ncbi:hypothetical protein QL996_13320 [Planococcus sp. APC 4015]|nr:hypothetical protein [Planococcus sp. APC 4015]
MSATHIEGEPATLVRERRVSRRLVLIAGVVLIPFALGLALNSYGALTADGAVRMAFATVAGQTVAILSAITAVIVTVKQKRSWQSLILMTIIAAVIAIAAVVSIASAGDLLLVRLEMIAEVDQING